MIKKIEKINLQEIRSRGSLMHILEFNNLKFKRVFTISNVPIKSKRGFHAHKIDTQLITVPSGKILFKTFDGKKRRKFFISSPKIGILVRPLIWTETQYLQKNTVVVVYSSHKYNEKSYIRSIEEFKKYIKKI